MLNISACSLAQSFQVLYIKHCEDGLSGTDFSIVCDELEIPVHSLVLSARSIVLEKAIQRDFKDNKEKKLKIEGFKPDSVKEMVRFMYGFEVTAEVEDLEELMRLGDMYEMEDLQRAVFVLMNNMEDDRKRNTKKLVNACRGGNTDLVEHILSNDEVDINATGIACSTPLMAAVGSDNLDMVRRILQEPQLDLGKKASSGRTALHFACLDNKVSIINLLCQDSRCSPSVVNMKNNIGETPLESALRNNHPDAVCGLLQHPGLNCGKRNKHGYAPLHIAYSYNQVSIVKLLCQDRRCSPSIVNMKDIHGFTLLVWAVAKGHLDIVKEIDKEGVDFRVKDKFGKTLIEWARTGEMFEYLIERNKKVDSLKVITAYSIARHVKNKPNVETLRIPDNLRHLLTGIMDND